ncbi:MAG: M56 family metallopeptidase [Lachnospiraceae bacterium]|nr:M56 family metallopeptidase [Ruminococcus sp.]MCM1277150.1 M56 family metallopeptidase [Lachnospiraceae bacterium]
MTLLEMSFYGSVLIVVVLIIRALFLNKLPKWTFTALWGLTILRLQLPFSIASAISVYSLIPDKSQDIAPTQETIQSASEYTISDLSPYSPEPGTLHTPPQSDKSISAKTIFFVVWCSGAVLSTLGFTALYIRAWRKFRTSFPEKSDYAQKWLSAHSLRRTVSIRRSDCVTSPLTYGLLRPVILLPDTTDISDNARLEYVLTHEWVHICRFDSLKKLLCVLALCLHWFNPLVWIMFFCFNRDLELACDEGVVLRLGADKKSDYAKTLIEMMAEQSGFITLFSHFGGFAAEERIKSIMNIKKSSFLAGVAACALVFGSAGVFATSAVAKENASNEQTAVLGGSASSVEWWTAEEYEAWIAEEKSELEALIGTGSGWYDGNGVFHTFTRESVDATISEYRKILKEIRNGALYSKDINGDVLFSGTADKVNYDDLIEDKQYFTADEFSEWITQQKEELRKLVEVGELTQAEADAAVQRYEELLNGIENGVLVEKRENPSDDWHFQSFPNSILTAETTATEDTVLEKGDALSPADEAALFAEFEAHGLTRRKSDNALIFNGKLVRWFVDGVDLDGEGAYATRYTYYNENGEVDIHTVWSRKDNGDGSYDPFGKLEAIVEYAEFDPKDFIAGNNVVSAVTFEGDTAQSDIVSASAVFEKGQTAVAQGDSTDSTATGKTFSEIFSEYQAFGITYNEAERNVYFNGKLVGMFADVSENGAFTFQSQSVGNRDTVDVRTVYENGRLISVREMTAREKNAGFVEE